MTGKMGELNLTHCTVRPYSVQIYNEQKRFLMQFDDLCRRTDTFSLNFVASKVCAKYELFAEKIKNRYYRYRAPKQLLKKKSHIRTIADAQTENFLVIWPARP
jgi:hypothetical protein